jgi:digeranylgeranylglycerophospholipid reductase
MRTTTEYDVIIVGAGPAGSSAAKTTAKRGFKTILIEEHPQIGVPTHCSGALAPVSRPDFQREVVESMDRRVILTKYKSMRVFAPSGKIVQELPWTWCYLVERSHLDRELASQAINAGADLLLHTRVSGLLKQNGRVIGVTTKSSAVPEVRGRIVIAADGIYAVERGIPQWEGLIKTGRTFARGIGLELTRVRDINPEVCEFHAGAFIQKGFTTLWPRDEASCLTHFTSMAEFMHVKEGNYPISKKLRDAVPVRVTPYSHTSDLGTGLPKLVADGLILSGSAANWRGIMPAIASGRDAGEMAAEAIERNDVTVNKLSKYEEVCKRLVEKGFLQAHLFYGRQDDDIEYLLTKLVEKNEGPFTMPRPV